MHNNVPFYVPRTNRCHDWLIPSPAGIVYSMQLSHAAFWCHMVHSGESCSDSSEILLE